MALKLFALVAALALVAAHASPLASDATHFDKVSEMIQDAQADNFGKAGMEAESMPAWETPAWMTRRTGNATTVSSTATLTGTFPASVQTNPGTEGTAGYVFFGCLYVKSIASTFNCPSTSQSVTARNTDISSYTQSVTFSRRTSNSAQIQGTMTTTKFTSTAAAQAAATNAQVDNALVQTAAAAASVDASTVAVTGTTVTGVTASPTPTPTPTPTAAAGRTTTFGIAALIAAMFAQLF